MKHSETEKTGRFSAEKIPLRSGLNLVYINTLVLLILMTGVSVTGIVFRSSIYPGEELSPLLIISLLLILGTLFLGLVPVLIVTAKLTGNPVNVADIMIVSGSSMIGMIPFILFTRGSTKASKSLQWKK